jgi:hypothetical protein
MNPATASARVLGCDTSPFADNARQNGAWRRASKVIGVVRTGVTPRSPADGRPA